MLGYRIPRPDEAMLISGGRKRKDGATTMRVVMGHGAFVFPFFRKAAFLSMKMHEAEIEERCVTKQGIEVTVRGVIAFKIGNDVESISNAGQRFLSDQSEIESLTGRIFAGHLRSIVGSMTVEEIVTERQKLATEVLDGSKAEMAKVGFVVDSLQIESIDDGDSGYIRAMSAPHQARIKLAAQTAQSEADRAAAEAQQASNQKQAEYTRQTAVVQAGYKSDVAKAEAQADEASQVAQARAAQSIRVAQAEAEAAVGKAAAEAQQTGPLAAATAQQDVAAEQTKLAAQQAELAEQQLLASVVRPAEAEAAKKLALAKADSESTKLLAEAAASSDRVSLDQLLIEQLPQLMQAAASGLQGANLTVLNGSEGLTELVTGFAAQAMSVYESVKNHQTQNGSGNGNTAPEATAPVPYARPHR